MEQIIQEAIASFKTLSLADKAGFTFWSLCVLGFYVSLGAILYLIIKDGVSKLKKGFTK